MHPSADIGSKDGTKCVGWCSSSSYRLHIFTLLLDKGQIKSYFSRNAVMASSFSCTVEMILVRRDLVSIPFPCRSFQSRLNPFSWIICGGGLTSWMIISTSISGLRRTHLDSSGSLSRYITSPFSWKYFKVSLDQFRPIHEEIL